MNNQTELEPIQRQIQMFLERDYLTDVRVRNDRLEMHLVKSGETILVSDVKLPKGIESDWELRMAMQLLRESSTATVKLLEVRDVGDWHEREIPDWEDPLADDKSDAEALEAIRELAGLKLRQELSDSLAGRYKRTCYRDTLPVVEAFFRENPGRENQYYGELLWYAEDGAIHPIRTLADEIGAWAHENWKEIEQKIGENNETEK